jgi:signal peptidase I
MQKITNYNWKRISRVLTNTMTVAIGLLIIGIIFFKFVPGFGFFIVKTGSMAPAINPGDIIFSAPAGNQVKPGQVITFELEKNILVTHRVISVENGFILTQGDANEEPDGFTLNMSQVQGKYLFKIPAVGQITTILHTKMGWFLIVIVPSILLVLWIVVEIIKEVFKETGPKKAGTKELKLTPPILARSAQGTQYADKRVVTPEKRQPAKVGIIPQTKNTTGFTNGITSKRLPSKEVVASIRKDLKYLLKDVY